MRDPVFTFRIPPATVQALDEVANARGTSRSDLVREAIALVLEQHHAEHRQDAA